MSETVKKVACFLPGVGVPVSLYYAFTNKEMRAIAIKGLALIPIAILVLGASSIMPAAVSLLAGAYLYWGVIAMAGGWGFLAMLLAYRAIEGKVLSLKQPIPIKQDILIPNASVSEVLPEMDAGAILSEIERLPEEEKEVLVAQLVKKK